MSENYRNIIVKHYEDCLEKHGDNHLGVDWPKQDDVYKRYIVMLDIIKDLGIDNNTVSLLDFGCGAGHLLEFINGNSNSLRQLIYSGLDISEKFISLCKKKFPNTPFYCLDILSSENNLPHFDYIIMNGVFTEKRELDFDEMWQYFCAMIQKVYLYANKGIAFNVMSKAVDWERKDLFHVSADMLIDFVTRNLTRNFIIRNDYRLYEYTVYLYRQPTL